MTAQLLSAALLQCGATAGAAALDAPFLAPYRGQVLLLLAGRADCRGTISATAVLDDYAAEKPEGVAILRLDVPLPREELKVGEWSHPYPRQVDEGRRLAERLGFFYYPTLYVFDRDGELRFTGGCDTARVRQMVAEILAEAPGAPKKSYTLPMPAVGKPAPAFSGQTLAGRRATLASLRGRQGTLLLFARTNCRLTLAALPSVGEIAGKYAPHGASVVIVNSGQTREEIDLVYRERTPGVTVVWDEGGRISKAYGVDMTPFYFLLDARGKVVSRRSFTPVAASGALNALLKLGAETPRYNPAEAG